VCYMIRILCRSTGSQEWTIRPTKLTVKGKPPEIKAEMETEPDDIQGKDETTQVTAEIEEWGVRRTRLNAEAERLLEDIKIEARNSKAESEAKHALRPIPMDRMRTAKTKFSTRVQKDRRKTAKTKVSTRAEGFPTWFYLELFHQEVVVVL
jgi:hypothetical protein